MGCLHSKKETSDLHPNVFRVVNIDEQGLDLCSGQLEITESDIILYREGRDSTVWPLHSLRRYGFEGEIFSFESGRRCETGEGIYAFRCRRAALLFRTLQQQIQLRNIFIEAYPVTMHSPTPQGRQTLQASVIHRSSIDNGPSEITALHNGNHNSNVTNSAVSRIATQSPRSPSSADILEVMPLYPNSQINSNHVTNVYQLREIKREHNNNQSDTGAELHHVYSNDLSRDLAILRNTLRQETALNTRRDIEDETRFLESRFINEGAGGRVNPLSPTLSNSSEHYAQLSIEQQEAGRLYMNIAPPDKNAIAADINKNEPSTPVTPKPVEYCNLSVGIRAEVNAYANLGLSDIADTIKNVKQNLHFNLPEHSQKSSESNNLKASSGDLKYIIIDVEKKDDVKEKSTRDLASPESHSNSSSKNESTASCSSNARRRLVSQSSVDKAVATACPAPAAIGYTTIDFDKTVALTSVAAGDVDLDGPRKTRHNSNVCGSPSSDKSKVIN